MKESVTIDYELEILQQELERVKSEKNLLESQMDLMLKEMNHFTYIVSHDLQAPLRMVTGFLELLEKKYGANLDETATSYINYAVKGSIKMKNLIFDLLAYSRLNTIPREITEVDLNEVVEGLREKLKTEIETTGASIYSGKLPVVLADKKQMEQMLFHLLGNAIKFQDHNTPAINITATKEQAMWKLAIKDNGIGIQASFFEKIFVVFRRLHSDEQKYCGTGIGLAMCKKIIELHEGTIWVESEVKNGSTFFVKLPVMT